MEKIVNYERYRGPIRNWWVWLVLGILFLAMGVVVFFHPGESYLTLSVLFGVGVIFAGVLDIFLASSTHVQSGRGWYIAMGIIEILLGVMMLFPAISGAMLPFILAFWLMFRGFMLIGTASDMIAWGIKGPGWVIALSVLLILCSFIVLFNPVIGIGAIVIWLGVSLVILGIALIVFAFDLNSFRKKISW